ncbi:MAG: NAD-dependent epimerase/dehydratase family protein [Candidatus Bathyarchaeia archaeon]|nr:NAD-dependent epimerase/dehydratase family protein [Candidatus Bathyarchaeota archaeon]
MRAIALVTGGAGFIGSHLVDRLLLEGWGVRVLDNFTSGSLENLRGHIGDGSVEVLNMDLKDPKAALSAVEGVEVVFHYAANPEVRVSATNPDIHFNENVVATFNLLEAMRRARVRQLIFASSSSVYGEPAEIPIDEAAPIKPISVYGASKAACENLIHAYSHLYGLKAVVLRYANVVGPRLRHGVVYDFIIKLLRDPNLLEILGDGGQMRSYIYVTDAIEATMIAWKKSAGTFEVYNVGGEDWVSVNDVTDVITEVMGLRGVRRVYKPILHGVGWPGDVKRIALSIDRIKALGWKPRMRSREALREAAKSILSEIRESAKP